MQVFLFPGGDVFFFFINRERLKCFNPQSSRSAAAAVEDYWSYVHPPLFTLRRTRRVRKKKGSLDNSKSNTFTNNTEAVNVSGSVDRRRLTG